MAYNASMYMPQGYQPVYQQQVQYQPPVNGLVSVTGIEGAKAFQLPPNSAMPLFDANADVLYLKTTDAAGYPTIRVFDFVPRADSSAAAVSANPSVEERLERIEEALAAISAERTEGDGDGKQHIRRS